MFSELLGFPEAQIAALPAHDLIAIGDQYDCMINTVAVPQARKGATTCLYEDVEEPMFCEAPMKHSLSYSQLSFPKAMMCKTVTHQWSRYQRLVVERAGDEADEVPAHVPTCDTKFSIF